MSEQDFSSVVDPKADGHKCEENLQIVKGVTYKGGPYSSPYMRQCMKCGSVMVGNGKKITSGSYEIISHTDEKGAK